VRTEDLPDGHVWLRLADPGWTNPLDARPAAARGGRWNPPDGAPTLYLNDTVATARANVRRFLAGTPVEPEDLHPDRGYVLVEVSLPTGQRVLDAHSVEGLATVGLPGTYPLDEDGTEVPHARCQPIGSAAFDVGLDGVRCRSAADTESHQPRELAWFPRGRRARKRRARSFGDWYFGAD